MALPIITFPEEAELADVTAAVLDALLEAQRQRLTRVLDIHQRVTRIVLAGGGTREIAETLYDLLRCPIVVLDAEGKPTVIVPSDAGTDLELTSGSAFVSGFGPATRITGRSSPFRMVKP